MNEYNKHSTQELNCDEEVDSTDQATQHRTLTYIFTPHIGEGGEVATCQYVGQIEAITDNGAQMSRRGALRRRERRFRSVEPSATKNATRAVY